MTTPFELEPWLRDRCAAYVYDLRGVFVKAGDAHDWPVTLESEEDLDRLVSEGGHLLPLPKESAALANVLEVSIVDFLLREISAIPELESTRGTERGYPDLEVGGDVLGGGYHAVDIKVARRKKNVNGLSKNTQSRITLYTGNTYFRHPTLHWPGTLRPFAEYRSHLDVLGIYTLNEESADRVEDLELIVQPAWKIASRQRSSTTREYIGAVMDISALREGRGGFESQAEFYKFWRKFKFKIGPTVQDQLDRALERAQQPTL